MYMCQCTQQLLNTWKWFVSIHIIVNPEHTLSSQLLLPCMHTSAAWHPTRHFSPRLTDTSSRKWSLISKSNKISHMKIWPCCSSSQKPQGDSPLPVGQNPAISNENNKALYDLTLASSPSPNSTLVSHSNHAHLLWLPEYSQYLLFPYCWGLHHQTQVAESTCTWISGTQGMQDAGSSHKRTLGKVLSFGAHEESWPRSLRVFASASCKYSTLEFIWSHPHDDRGRRAWVSISQTNPSSLSVCQQPGVKGKGIPPTGRSEIQGSVIARVPGKSVAPSRTTSGSDQTCHFPVLGRWLCLWTPTSSSGGGEWS